MKYEYLLKTWGGFYNKQHQDKHGEVEGCHYFDSLQERRDYLKKLRQIEKKINANYLAVSEGEGYNVRTSTTLHRVIKFEEKEYYSKRDLGPNYPYSAAMLHLNHKWRPGFNDYPLGEDFDYYNSELEIVQEWITGAF